MTPRLFKLFRTYLVYHTKHSNYLNSQYNQDVIYLKKYFLLFLSIQQNIFQLSHTYFICHK